MGMRLVQLTCGGAEPDAEVVGERDLLEQLRVALVELLLHLLREHRVLTEVTTKTNSFTRRIQDGATCPCR